MKELTYKEEYILNHGHEAYAEKLAKNAAWRKANPSKAEGYAEKRSRKGSGKGKTVLFIGDIHIGSSGVDVDEIKGLAKKYWYRKPIVIMGDICDLGLDRGMEWDNKFGPQAQYDMAKEILKPLNVVAYTLGNHEERIWNKVGMQPFKDLFGMPQTNEIVIGKRKIYFNHGVSTAQDAFREHQRYIKWKNADIYCLGHNHVLAKLSYMRDGKITHLCRTGSFLRPVKYTITAGFDPKIRGWCEYDTAANIVHLEAINEETGEIFEI